KTVLGSESQRITAFEVVDGNGYKYIFGNLDVNYMSSLTAVETTTYSRMQHRIRLGFPHLGTVNLGTSGPYYWFRHVWGTPGLITEGSNNQPSIRWIHESNWMTFTSSWHLTRIESPSGDYVTFNYSPEDYKYTLSYDYDIGQPNNLERFIDQGSTVY